MGIAHHRLVATLGTTWAVVPEVYGIFTDLYGHRTPAEAAGIPAPDRIDLITTRTVWEKAEGPLSSWAQSFAVPLVPYILEEPDLTDQAGVRRMRELIFRVVLAASEEPGQLTCSLAGGRKTMSADMQEAARTFGCRRLVHVLSDGAPSQWPDALRNPQPTLFTEPLPEEIQRWILPVVLPGSRRADLLDVAWQDCPPVHSARFPPAEVVAGTPPPPAGSPSLPEEIAARRADRGLLSSFIAEIERDEKHENWRSLYRLAPRLIQSLRETPVTEKHRDLLEQLPKADLHRHLGGSLGLEDQARVAEAIWMELPPPERDRAIARVRKVDWNDQQARWRDTLREGNRPANTAAVFQELSLEAIESVLFPPGEERTALRLRHPLGFAAYELPGELSGSAVLSHPAALQPTVRALLRQARSEHLRYLELRGSPHKYAPDNPGEWLRQLRDTLRAEHDPQRDPVLRFLWIADRRHSTSLPSLLHAAVQTAQELPDFLVGLDLAGDESVNDPAVWARAFEPVFAACLPITIHAGEGQPAENIWEAAYHLHADRVGHGLSLAEHAQLRDRFRDRDICLELCPTSNREVVGFSDPAYPGSHHCPPYPLLQLWQSGVPVTLCTDNPGISRCTLADEYLAASRMVGQLSLWDALALTKQAFRKAFAEVTVREDCLKAADHEIGRVVGTFFGD